MECAKSYLGVYDRFWLGPVGRQEYERRAAPHRIAAAQEIYGKVTATDPKQPFH